MKTSKLKSNFIDESKEWEDKVKDMEVVIKKTFPNLVDSPLEFKVLKGGLTNRLYLCSVKTGVKIEKYLLRTNGAGSEKIIHRNKELEILEKYSHHGGATVYSVFGNGIVYDYFEGRALTNTEMREKSHQSGIAREVARLHKVKIDICDKSICVDHFLETWLKQVRAFDVKDEDVKKRLDKIDLEKIGKEVLYLKKVAEKWKDRVVFCHNDLLSGNIVYNEEEKSYKFIDFEYAGMNYRGFDIGDHFAEYMGFDCDGYRPAKEHIMNFLKHYLMEFNDTEEVSEKELEELYVECMIGTLQSNLMWGVWALFCSFCKKGFDYLHYGEEKIEIYFKEKEIVLKELGWKE